MGERALSPEIAGLLLPHQVEPAQRLLDTLRSRGRALDASDTGVGKTYTAMAVAKALEVTPLVICPFSVRPAWKKAAAFFGHRCEVVNYEKARGVRRKYHWRNPRVFGPSMVRLSKSAWGQEVKVGKGSKWEWARNYRMFIFDEVHRCAGASSLNSKLLRAAGRQGQYVLALSATFAESPLELGALGEVLGLHNRQTWRRWLFKHGCKPGVFGGYVFAEHEDPDKQAALRRRHLLNLHKELFPTYGTRVRKTDIPGFPKTQLGTLLVDSTAPTKAARLVREIQEAWEELQEMPAAERPHHLAELVALQQALELLLVDPFVDLAVDAVRANPVVLFVNYTETARRLVAALSKHGECGLIDGSVTGAEREKVERRFQADEIPFCVVNSQAGGEGISLHGRADRDTFVAPLYRAKAAKQLFGRVNRAGGAYSRQHLVYFADTKQEEIAAALEEKLTQIDTLNDGILHGSH